ncbi:MAG: hypothetical protein NC086_09625, partial [Alistipes sp.]|nr:hypothetical protein [Alistipes sp.]
MAIQLKVIRQCCILFLCAILCVILTDLTVNRLTQKKMKELSVTDDIFREMDLSKLDVDWIVSNAK